MSENRFPIDPYVLACEVQICPLKWDRDTVPVLTNDVPKDCEGEESLCQRTL